MAAMKEDDRTNQRLEWLVQRFAQTRLSATFAAWKVGSCCFGGKAAAQTSKDVLHHAESAVLIPQEEAEFERSVHQLDALLQGCEVGLA